MTKYFDYQGELLETLIDTLTVEIISQ